MEEKERKVRERERERANEKERKERKSNEKRYYRSKDTNVGKARKKYEVGTGEKNFRKIVSKIMSQEK